LASFWGVGASISPYIMSFSLGTHLGWRGGYATLSVIQIVLTIILFATLQKWKNGKIDSKDSERTTSKPLTIARAVKIKGVPSVLIAFFG